MTGRWTAIGPRCGIPCGLRDSRVVGAMTEAPRQHYCLVIPRGHDGRCEFIGTCGRSRENAAGALKLAQLRARPCRHGGHTSARAALACLERFGVPGFEVVAIPGLEGADLE
jgi:hypothetical protein